jgi:hypothetical protein
MRHRRGCDCDNCYADEKVAKLRRHGWTPCQGGCGELNPPGTTGDFCATCEPCERCAGEGVYEQKGDDTGAERYCTDCDAGLDTMFASGEPWLEKLYPKAHADYLKRQAATAKEAA